MATAPGALPAYTLRHSTRSRHLRITIDPELGLVVTVPPATRRGWARPESRIETFLREREPWIRRHLDRRARDRAELAARGGLSDGALLRFRGDLHRLRVAPVGAGRSSVTRIVSPDGFELRVAVAGRDRERIGLLLETWLRDQAQHAIES